MAIELTILVGTMTGTADLVAEDISDVLEEAGHEITVEPMDQLDGSVFEDGRIYLICCATYGQGDVPDNAIKLYEDLQSSKPDLKGVRYGVFALGDRTYADTFCQGGRRFDKILSELGARRIGDLKEHDASAGTMPEEVGAEWARGWIENFNQPRAVAA